VVAPVSDGMIAGFGGLGYRLAISAVAGLLAAGRGDRSAAQTTGDQNDVNAGHVNAGDADMGGGT
jgi:hypothetical protein